MSTEGDPMDVVFQSPTHGSVTFARVLELVAAFVADEPLATYELAIGTDSQKRDNGRGGARIEYVTALTVRRVGNGGIFFYRRTTEDRPATWPMRDRIYEETMRSATLGQEVRSHLRDAIGQDALDGALQVHIDVGENGPTRAMIGELRGVVQGYGLEPYIKPDAYCAAAVADRHT